MTDPNLVLAVSMPSILNGYPKFPLKIQGCSVVVQVRDGCNLCTEKFQDDHLYVHIYMFVERERERDAIINNCVVF